MIDNFYITTAKRIRKEFLSLNAELDKYSKDVKKLSDFFKSTAVELEKYQKGLKKDMNMDKVKDYLMEKLNNAELESKKLSDKIVPINKSIENLRKEEIILYNTLKSKYPDLSDDDLKKTIFESINEKS